MGNFTAQMVSSHGFEYGVKHFYNHKIGLLSNIIQDALQLSKEDVLNLLNLGSVYINNERQFSDNTIESQKLFRVHTKPRRFPIDHAWLERIVFQNDDFLIFNKPCNLPSHPSVDNILDNALTQLELALEQKLYITHRLDSLTEGLIVYAKTKTFVKAFNEILKNRQIEKKYSAICETNKSLPRRLIHYMKPSARAPKEISEVAHDDWLLCELEIQDQQIRSHLSLVKINLLTGRTHQIRAQLSEKEAPIVGDQLYGSKTKWINQGIALKACELQFTYDSKIFKFTLPEFEPNLNDLV